MNLKSTRAYAYVVLILSTVPILFCFTHVSHASNKDTVAFVLTALSNPFFSKIEESALNYANSQQIHLEVFGVDRATDINRQISIVENLISRGYGAIVIAPVDSKRLIPVCKKALDNDIAVINVDSPLDRQTLNQLGISIPFIGSNDFAGGHMLGSYISNQLSEGSRLLLIEGIKGAENSDQRKTGFINALSGKVKIEIVSTANANWHRDEAFSLVTKLLKRHGPVEAIFCANDTMALGALQAAELLGFSDNTIITGYDNIDSVRTEMRNGRIHATVEQHPEDMGALGVKFAVAMMNNEDVPLFHSTPLDLVTYESFGKKVTFSISTLGNSFFTIMSQSAKETADLFGIELKILDADNQDTHQLVDLADSLAANTDMLIVNPANTESIYPGIELANTKGVPVITVDRKASAGSVACHIESDNTEGGKLAARFMATKLDSGSVLELEGIPGTSAAYERGAGFNEELKKHENIKVKYREVANFSRKEAKAVTIQLLHEGKKFNGVFAHNDNMILGLIDAFEESDVQLPEILIGFDAIPEAKESVKQNKLTATIAQQPDTMGTLVISTATRVFRREKIPSEIFVGLSLITD